MKERVLICLLIIGVISCNTYKGVELSKFRYNNKKANNRIIDRYPEYGDGRKDGCIIRSEMSLNLNGSRSGNFEGKLTDVVSREPIINALVTIQTKNSEKIEAISDSLGVFKFNAPNLKGIRIEYIGYRRLIIGFDLH